MQDKQKATLYLSSEIYRQLKIRAAIDQDPMSSLAEKAIAFYLSYPDAVENSGIGHTHQVYGCPECAQQLVIKDGELMALNGKSNFNEKLNDKPKKSAAKQDIKQEIKQDEELAIF